MQQNPLFFEHLPVWPTKPRTQGLTMVRDVGIPLSALQAIIASYGHLLDYLKFRQFVAWYMRPEELRAKISACTQAQIKTFVGGTVLEAAHLHNKTRAALETMVDYGFSAVEVSASVVPLSIEQLSVVVRMARGLGLEVLYEYGKKFQQESFDVGEAVRNIQGILDAGANMVIFERWQLEAAIGIAGERNTSGRIIELAERVGLENLVFEAESVKHQLWLVKNLGPGVNLGPNIEPSHVPAKLALFRTGIGSEMGYSIFDLIGSATATDVKKLFEDAGKST